MDYGILVVESWLMSATEYIAIDNTLLRPGVGLRPQLITLRFTTRVSVQSGNWKKWCSR